MIAGVAVIQTAQPGIGSELDMADLLGAQGEELTGSCVSGDLIGSTDYGLFFGHIVEGTALWSAAQEHPGGIDNGQGWCTELCQIDN